MLQTHGDSTCMCRGTRRNTEEHGGRGKVEGEHRERGTLEEGGITSSYRTAKGRSPQLVQNFMETQRIVGNSVSGCWASRSDRPAGEKRHRSLAFHHVNMLLTEIKPSFTRPRCTKGDDQHCNTGPQEHSNRVNSVLTCIKPPNGSSSPH